MQITHLKMVIEECTRDLGDEGAVQIDGYYQYKGAWWGVATAQQAAAEISGELEKCLEDGAPYRTTKSKWANFVLAELKAVVRAEFYAPLRSTTLDAVQRIVLRGYRNASNAFAVKYNPMTGLLAKAAFQELVERRLRALRVSEDPSTELRAAESSPPALCLLAVDIDHFKQVNDSFGHAYGDLVLRAFAMRFQHTVNEFCSRSPTKIEASCAHVSGEEFFCVTWGEADAREFEGLADTILEAIRDSALPSDMEIERLRASTPNVDLTLPSMSTRRITCSLGGVICGAPTSLENQVSAPQLINQADVALYKSKNQGRDRTTFFASILQTGGRVIEHRADVHICILDIGSDVGVTKGQEFLVYHPEFTGKKPYILDDGRSRKVLGKLPRLPLCTIAVFDVQRDISFCRVSDERFLQIPIPPNAVLEAIPLGTLSAGVVHAGMVWMGDEAITSVASIADTHQRISGKVDPKDKLSFVVVGIRNESQLLSDYGTAVVNRALGTACRYLQSLAEGGFVGQVETTKLLLQVRTFEAHQQQELDAALEKAEKDHGGRVKFAAGVYAGGGYGRVKDERELPRIEDVKTRVDLARYAASAEGILERSRVHVFTHNSATYILSKLQKARDFKRGLADYDRFSEIGMRSPELDNAGGLLAYSSNNMARAEVLFSKAAEQAPSSDIVYRVNVVISQVLQGNIEVAARTADAIDHQLLETNYRNHPFGTVCLAVAIAERATKAASSVQVDTEIRWLRRALELAQSDHWSSRLMALLGALEQRQTNTASATL